MTDFEQFEAWIEMRILQRRATRAEVYALRRYRRADTRATRHALFAAYIAGAFREPIERHVRMVLEAMQPVVEKMRVLAELFAESETEAFAATDLREFDNRAHDWIRG